MYKTILVPIDLSHPEPGKAMIDVAKTIAGEDSTITLIHVVEGIPAHVAVDLPEGIIEKSLERARVSLEEIARNAGLPDKVEVRAGPA